MRLLLVEDDELLGDGIRIGLKQYGYTVDWVQDGHSAQLSVASGESFDMIILDLGLPKKSGLEVLSYIRSKDASVPVLILTARDTIEDQVLGLDGGADDYMVKPFDLEVLCARIRALQRRKSKRIDSHIEHGAIKVNPASHHIEINDNPVIVSRREFTLLTKLLDEVGRVVTRESLTQSLYGWDDEVDSNTIEVHIHNIRKKFGHHLKIRTIRGVGYMVEKLND